MLNVTFSTRKKSLSKVGRLRKYLFFFFPKELRFCYYYEAVVPKLRKKELNQIHFDILKLQNENNE